MSDFLFSVRKDGNAQLDSYEGNNAHVVIPSRYDGKPVTAIAENAFAWQSGIKTVVIPDTVTTALSRSRFPKVSVLSVNGALSAVLP